jgi:hypothetical protein
LGFEIGGNTIPNGEQIADSALHHIDAELLEDYVLATSSSLVDRENETVEQHLLVCPECRQSVLFVHAISAAALALRRDG